MFCEKCGSKLTPGDAFCTQCGAPIPETKKEVVVQSVEDPEDKKKANMLCTISLILKYGMGLIVGVTSGVFSTIASSSTSHTAISSINAVLASLSGIAGLGAFVLMIVVRVKYPKNTFGKVIMWIYIIELILSILAAIILIVACASALSAWGRMG